jgi:hypothetical protein
MGRCGLFVLKKAVRWVRLSAPTGCSPQGLGGISYPFKGFESSGPAWGRRDVAPGSSYCDARVPVCGKVGRCFSCDCMACEEPPSLQF